jgi:hypothetical protein
LRAGLIKIRIVIKPGNPTLWQGLSVRSSLNYYTLENYRAIVTTEPTAWFAVGWLIAQLSACEARCTKVLSEFTTTDVPWLKVGSLNDSHPVVAVASHA